jgi:hypothetical protein
LSESNNDDVEQVEVEVRAHRVRRRRSEPTTPITTRPPSARNWVIYAALALLIAALMFEGYLSHRPRDHALPALSDVTEVRSILTPAGDSLRVVVSWDLTLSAPEGQPDSIRISIVPATGGDSLVAMQPSSQFRDTAFVAAPAPGQALGGISCVSALHSTELAPVGICTPWQFVRPMATAQAAVTPAQRIVIQPSGLQVDPDVDGKCAQWQQTHPGKSVWILTNRTAVRACMGANGKPTVAQFCAFMVLPDGRKVKTANSANNAYCDELFEEWIRERLS